MARCRGQDGAVGDKARQRAATSAVFLTAIMPNSAACPRRALIAWVHWFTSILQCLKMMLSACLLVDDLDHE